MPKTETHFEQVPKSVVEQILAKQNSQPERESDETPGSVKSSDAAATISTRPFPRK
jgi:hypothetical protein